MKKIILISLIFLFSFVSVAQEISQLEIKSERGSAFIPVYNRQETIYFSVKHFAEVLGLNYYYNSEAEKVELKFENYNLKVTSKNPFLVLTTKGNNIAKVYQLPTSTYYINNQIFIPIVYSLDILETAFGKKFSFNSPDKLTINEETSDLSMIIENEDEVRYNKTGSKNIYGLTIDEKANGTLVRVHSNKEITSAKTTYNAGVVTLTLTNVIPDKEKIESLEKKGMIEDIKVKELNGHTQIQFQVTDDYSKSEVIKLDGSHDILLTIHNKIFDRSNFTNKNKEKWNFDVIVIDAGHGGKDAGAIGVNGVKEKDINLSIALKLGKLIEQNMKDVKVVYTRKTDKFVELYKRGKIANENDGKLFISIHCNSLNKKPSSPNGFEVYLLRPGRTQEAIKIAEMENSVIEYEDNPDRYEKLTDENFILVSMAQSSYMKYSEKYAEILDNQFSSNLNLKSRGVKQAGFYVLVGASMPSVLIETGFLSNKNDAAYLSSGSGQQKIAQSIFEGIKKFKAHYEKVLDTEL